MINIKYERDNHRAAAYDNEKEIGFSTYSESENHWIIDHIETNPEYSGQGVATKLVAKLVEQARINNIKIVPLCPFAKSEFDKRPEYSDVLAK